MIKDSVLATASLRCDCLCSTVVVDKIQFGSEPGYYNISFQDSAINWKCFSIKERIKAAWHMLTKKPYSYADVCIENEVEFAEFVGKLVDMVGMRQITKADNQCHLCFDCPDGCPLYTPEDSKNTPGRFDNEEVIPHKS